MPSTDPDVGAAENKEATPAPTSDGSSDSEGGGSIDEDESDVEELLLKKLEDGEEVDYDEVMDVAVQKHKAGPASRDA
jgi:hypothetical protein